MYCSIVSVYAGDQIVRNGSCKHMGGGERRKRASGWNHSCSNKVANRSLGYTHMCRCGLISASICAKCHLAKEHVTRKRVLRAHTELAAGKLHWARVLSGLRCMVASWKGYVKCLLSGRAHLPDAWGGPADSGAAVRAGGGAAARGAEGLRGWAWNRCTKRHLPRPPMQSRLHNPFLASAPCLAA